MVKSIFETAFRPSDLTISSKTTIKSIKIHVWSASSISETIRFYLTGQLKCLFINQYTNNDHDLYPSIYTIHFNPGFHLLSYSISNIMVYFQTVSISQPLQNKDCKVWIRFYILLSCIYLLPYHEVEKGLYSTLSCKRCLKEFQ